MKQLVLAFLLVQLVADDVLKDRPAFSLGDQPAQVSAQCGDIRKMSAGLERPDHRIDLTITGELTTVRADGALWYLVMCSDLRVMCVTYESNDMKVGDTVLFRGGYKRLDANHAVLDPCLANAGAQ